MIYRINFPIKDGKKGVYLITGKIQRELIDKITSLSIGLAIDGVFTEDSLNKMLSKLYRTGFAFAEPVVELNYTPVLGEEGAGEGEKPRKRRNRVPR